MKGLAIRVKRRATINATIHPVSKKLAPPDHRFFIPYGQIRSVAISVDTESRKIYIAYGDAEVYIWTAPDATETVTHAIYDRIVEAIRSDSDEELVIDA